jgi:hypothetical protein
MLHLTNGDSAAGSIRHTGVTGDVVSWRDILHEGPVPAGLTLEGMSDVRARFLASWGEGSFPEISASLGARDSALRAARRVVLWFEHDLYDQLQLLQILATLATQPETTAELICVDAFPGVVPFYGLGQLTPLQLATLWPQRHRITPAQVALAAKGWKAFTSPDRLAVRKYLDADLVALPLLRGALDRLLEEHPTAPTGLSRTERQILGAVAAGNQSFADVFRANQAQETAPFMGDTTLHKRIASLVESRTPLLTPAPHSLTAAGQRVLAGEVDARQLNGIDRWLGGVHFQS